MPRLPEVGSDDGRWGDLLNEFLLLEHNTDGSLKIRDNLAAKYARPNGGIPETDLSAQVQEKLNTPFSPEDGSIAKTKLAPLTIGDDDVESISIEKVIGLEDRLASKQSAITLSTVGTTGTATFTDGVLNIPAYQVSSQVSPQADISTTSLAGNAFVTIGNSFNVPDASLQRSNHHYTQSLKDRMHLSSLTTHAVGGTNASQIALNTISSNAATNVPVRNKVYVGAAIMGNNMFFGSGAANQKTVSFASQTIMATLTADAKIPADTNTFVYTSGFAAYALGTSMGAAYIGTFDDGAYAEFNFTGAQGVDIVFYARSSNSGVYRINDVTNNGTLLGELDTNGLQEGDINSTPIIFKVRGLGAGTHKIRVTKISGTGMFLDGILIPSTAPRSGYVVSEMLPDLARVSFPGIDFTQARETLWPIVANVVAEYPSFKAIQPSLDGWDPVTMTADGLHANDRGQDYLFREVSKELVDTPYTIGNGNIITQNEAYPAAYVAPSVPSVPIGGSTGSAL